MFAFSPKFAMTYEIPLAKELNIEDVDAFKEAQDEIQVGGGGFPVGPEGDGTETGVGDMNLRFFYRTSFKLLNFDWLAGAEFVFPTANQDELASETFTVKPMVAMVSDLGFWPAPGAFLALMHFYGFDAWQDDNRDDVSQYIGRYFFMLPIHPSGIYTLPEFQFIYDFEKDHASYWVGPEVGKLLAPGRIIYAKPGWGIDPDSEDGDRKWSVEVGFRYFM